MGNQKKEEQKKHQLLSVEEKEFAVNNLHVDNLFEGRWLIFGHDNSKYQDINQLLDDLKIEGIEIKDVCDMDHSEQYEYEYYIMDKLDQHPNFHHAVKMEEFEYANLIRGQIEEYKEEERINKEEEKDINESIELYLEWKKKEIKEL